MMKILHLLLVTAILNAGNIHGQTWPSNCSVPDTTALIYRYDVGKLALARLHQLNSPWLDSVELPQALQDSLAKALYAIHNMPPSGVKDTIMNLFGFRDFNPAPALSFIYEEDSSHIMGVQPPSGLPLLVSFGLKRVKIEIMNGAGYATDWAAGNYYNTSNSALNAFLLKHELVVQPVSSGASTSTYNLVSKRPINTEKIAAIFNNSYTNAYTEPNYFFDGHSMRAIFEPDGIIVEYRYGCGDCMLGCTSLIYWRLKVFYNSCSVQYLSREALNIMGGSTIACFRGTIMSLPEIHNLSATSYVNTAILKWSGSANISRYEVQKAIDGINYVTINEVPANQNLAGDTYEAIDKNPFQGLNYYRVKMLTNQGKTAYSNVVTLKYNHFTHLKVVPNPIQQHQLNLVFTTSHNERFSLELLSTAGQNVFKTSLSTFGNVNKYSIPLPKSIAKGMYHLRVYASNTSYTALVSIE